MLILASASPRRRELLTQAGFSFQVEFIPVAEEPRPGEDPIHLVKRLAREKADAVFRAHNHRHAIDDSLLVLGADTVVVCDHEILNKPVDEADAARMLRLLAGRTHQVITGVCLISSHGVEVAAETTRVTMLTMSDEEILAYVATREPMDKAGAYAIQGHASRWIPRIVGCYFNVVGLPVALVNTMLESVHRKLAPHPVP
ncbi:MAG TPA: Maf family protein [Acidobacteriaceae bacterium]|nr:Maf family protein [Terriglobia bacterium]HVC89993.1 Maf family protein [Acidobacteriaceae bacterium]